MVSVVLNQNASRGIKSGQPVCPSLGSGRTSVLELSLPTFKDVDFTFKDADFKDQETSNMGRLSG